MDRQKYEAVRKAVIAAVPEIMELKFGCEIKIFDKVRRVVRFGLEPDKEYVWFEFQDSEPGFRKMMTKLELELMNDVKILGRPIRLADVLVAIGKQPVPRYWCAVDCDGDFYDMEHEGIALSNGYRWNLRQDNLSLQSLETIDFLHSILVK